MEKLTIQEEEVMLHIWSMGECFVKDIVAKFPEPKPPYTTVASIVNNLKRKGYVTAKRFGNTYQYTPVVKQSEYKRTFVSGVVRNYFADSYKEMVSFFAKEQKISAADLKDIINLIEKEEDEGGNLAASKIRNLECPSYEICLIDYGCGKFNRKIHIMEQYP